MSPKELKSLMERSRTSSAILAEALGIAPQQIRKWRVGTRPIPERHIAAMRLLFRDRAKGFKVEPRSLSARPERVDPAEIVPAPIENRLPIEPRDEQRPSANRATIVEAINSFVAILSAPRRRADPTLVPALAKAEVTAPTARPLPLSLFRRDERGLPARPIARPQLVRPQIIDATPLGPPAEPFSAPRGPRCCWPHTDVPGAPSGPCEQLVAPGLPYCALHWVQHVGLRQRSG